VLRGHWRDLTMRLQRIKQAVLACIEKSLAAEAGR
jgi:hypothetical protein